MEWKLAASVIQMKLTLYLGVLAASLALEGKLCANHHDTKQQRNKAG